MYLPNKERAIVEIKKVKEYLLNPEHRTGKHKARFFTKIGFSLDNPQVLQKALKQHPINHECAKTIDSEHGVKFIIEGSIITPENRMYHIRTVWMIPTSEELAKLVTAYPI